MVRFASGFRAGAMGVLKLAAEQRDHLRLEVDRLKVELARLRVSRRKGRAKARRSIRWMR